MFIRMQNVDDPRDIDVERLMAAFQTLLPTTRDADLTVHVANFMEECLTVLGAVNGSLAARVAKSIDHLVDEAEHEELRLAAGNLSLHAQAAVNGWDADNDAELEQMAREDAKKMHE